MQRFPPSQRTRRLPTEGLLVGLLLGAAFLALSFVRIVGDANSAMFGGRVLSATLDQPFWGTSLGWKLALYGAAQIVSHLALGALAWLLASLSPAAWPHSSNGVRAWTLFWSLVLIGWVLTANAAWYPSSSLGYPYAAIANHAVLGVSVFGLVSLAVWGAVALTLLRFLLRRRETFGPVLVACAGTAGLTLGVALVAGPAERASAISGTDADRPNVILIGFDSLRTDHVGTSSGTSLTPEIDRFMAGATVFTDAITPLARTFPAWVSILSGRHPHTTGAVINLLPRELIHEGTSLPELLRENGYETFYGIDEVRFSNLDQSYGFDHMMSPPIGSTDFLVGFFADTPLSNLLVNTPVGRWLFPQLHGNRAATVTYNPDTFIRMLERGIRPTGPSFIAVHFTLPHWPYTWASGPPFLRGTGRIDDLVTAYPRAVERVDRQFGDLIELLEAKGALDNAIVIVLSDHGESLGDILPIKSEQQEDMRAYGHGTNVLANYQYDVLLGMRSFGAARGELAAGAIVDAPVSLEDIAPTVADILRLEPAQGFDGQSLLPLLAPDTAERWAGRARFIETEFNPPGFDLDQLTQASELTDAAKAYRIDPVTDRVLIRAENIPEILASRQYAIVRDGHLLASLPVGGGETQSLVFARAGGDLTWHDAAPDPLVDPLAAELWQLLGERFAPVRDRPVTSFW